MAKVVPSDSRRDALAIAAAAWVVSLVTGANAQAAAAHASAAAPRATAAPVAMGAAPLRRLTRLEYTNTVHDLLGPVAVDADTFPEEGGSGFDNNADLAVATRIHAQKYMSTAESVAAQAVTNLPALLCCQPTLRTEASCLEHFISRFATRAWRRPLAPQEEASLLAFAAEHRQRHDLQQTVARVIEAVLESPHFLYRVEMGRAVPGDPAILRLTDWEMASRLSYFLWGTMPSERLFQLARRGRLHTPEQVRRAAGWMMRDERTHATMRRFHEQWLGLGLFERLQKDKDRFPQWNKDVAALMKAQFDRFIDHVLWRTDGRLETLLTTTKTVLNEPLARFIRVDASGLRGAEWHVVEDSRPAKAGIFTLPAFLAQQSNVEETSPIKRGIFVREQLLCQIPPPPPANLMMNRLPPATAELVTVRERLEEHKLGFGCAKCHELFDPLGFAFENFDATGLHRTHEGGHPVDTTGELVQSDVDGAFTDGVQLAARLAHSASVRQCFVKQWFRFAFARTESDADAQTLAGLNAAFDRSGHRIIDLMLAIVQSDAFMHLPRANGQQQMAHAAEVSP